MEITRRAGAVISIICCRPEVRCAGSSTTPHCRTCSCRRSWRPSELVRRRRLVRWNLPFLLPHERARSPGQNWDEIDFDGRAWVIPAERMKAGQEHRVPLSDHALEILKRMKKVQNSDYVFPGDRRATLSNMAFLMLLRRMNRDDITAHGFRSTFRDWVEEQTDTPRAVAEMALAHTIGSAVEAAYRRGDLFEKRRILMARWADFCKS